MYCENCGSKLKVVSSRQSNKNYGNEIAVYRQHNCSKCSKTFYTKEVLIDSITGRSAIQFLQEYSRHYGNKRK